MSETSFLSTAYAVAQLGDFGIADDDLLLAGQQIIAAHRRELDAVAARNAAEIARRSAPELGFSGLARKRGFVNTASLLQSVTGSSKAEASKLVRVGELMNTPASPVTGEVTWEGTLGGAVNDGRIGVDSANAIRLGLGGNGTPADETLLTRATDTLLAEVGKLDVDQVARRARELRDELDAAGIALREKHRRDLRDFRVRRRPDGMVAGSFLLSDEDAALALAIYDQATGPKHVGPRFVETAGTNNTTADLNTANSAAGGTASGNTPSSSHDPVVADSRTRGQKAADVFAGLLRIGAETDDNTILGLHRPAVQILVNADTIAARHGHGGIEGATDYPISFTTVERHLCASGVIGVAFDDDGNSLNVGREQRLYTRKQRIALKARDGGCRFPGCDRPRPGPKRTTSTTGIATTAKPPSTTGYCSAGCITSSSTTTTGPSPTLTASTGSHHPPTSTLTKCPDPCHQSNHSCDNNAQARRSRRRTTTRPLIPRLMTGHASSPERRESNPAKPALPTPTGRALQ